MTPLLALSGSPHAGAFHTALAHPRAAIAAQRVKIDVPLDGGNVQVRGALGTSLPCNAWLPTHKRLGVRLLSARSRRVVHTPNLCVERGLSGEAARATLAPPLSDIAAFVADARAV